MRGIQFPYRISKVSFSYTLNAKIPLFIAPIDLCSFCTGLKSLSIRLCPSVTTEGLVSCVKLPYLQHFDYITRDPIPKSFVARIASQNPSLEAITVHLSNMSVDNRLTMDDILKEITHPRLTTLINKVSNESIPSKQLHTLLHIKGWICMINVFNYRTNEAP